MEIKGLTNAIKPGKDRKSALTDGTKSLPNQNRHKTVFIIETLPNWRYNYNCMKILMNGLKLKIAMPLFFLSILMLSCQDQTGSLDQNTNPLLINCWKHSYEEDPAGDVDLYRPCDSMEFPLSRFRGTITFKENGECEYLVLSPNDAHYFQSGRWEFVEETQTILIRDEHEAVVKELQVVELVSGRLVIRE